MSGFFWLTVGRIFAQDRSPVRKRGGWGGRVLRFALVLAVAGAIIFAFKFPDLQFFAVREVHVYGAGQISADQVAASSGFDGRNIVLLDPGKEVARLESNPYISSATVQRNWLSRTVEIDIQERTPQLVWENSTGSYLVSDTGVVLQEVKAVPRMPTIQVYDKHKLVPGDRIDRQQVASALTLYQQLPPDLKPEIEKVTYDPETGYRVISTAGWTAVLGDNSRMQVKLDVMRVLLNKRGVKLVDVSNPVTPYYRYSK